MPPVVSVTGRLRTVWPTVFVPLSSLSVPLLGLTAGSDGPVGLPFLPLLLTNPAGRSASTA